MPACHHLEGGPVQECGDLFLTRRCEYATTGRGSSGRTSSASSSAPGRSASPGAEGMVTSTPTTRTVPVGAAAGVRERSHGGRVGRHHPVEHRFRTGGRAGLVPPCRMHRKEGQQPGGAPPHSWPRVAGRRGPAIAASASAIASGASTNDGSPSRANRNSRRRRRTSASRPIRTPVPDRPPRRRRLSLARAPPRPQDATAGTIIARGTDRTVKPQATPPNRVLARYRLRSVPVR